MKKSILKLGLIATLMIGMTSCATMISGSEQKVTFETNAKNANVYSNFEYVGEANTQIPLKRHSLDKMYKISAEGCRDTSIVLETKFNNLIWIDVINPIAVMIDFAAGAQFKSTEKVVKVELDCSSK